MLFVLMLCFLCPRVAGACSCLSAEPKSDADFQALVDEAEIVFEGRSVEPRWEGDFSVDTFEVLRIFKGPHRTTVEIPTGMRRTADENGYGYSFTSSSCDSSFERGRTYLVFAYKGDSGALFSSVCSPTRESRKARRWFKFLEKDRSESAPPAIEAPSGCRASNDAPTEILALGLVMLLGGRVRRRHRKLT